VAAHDCACLASSEWLVYRLGTLVAKNAATSAHRLAVAVAGPAASCGSSHFSVTFCTSQVTDLYRGGDLVCVDEEWLLGVRLFRFMPVSALLFAPRFTPSPRCFIPGAPRVPAASLTIRCAQ
jgi:hypothetical protein